MLWTKEDVRRRGVSAKLVSFAKGFSKHPHILAIFNVDSEYLRFPFKVKVDYLILYLIIVYSFVTLIFLYFLLWRKEDARSKQNSSFIRMFTCSSVNRNERRLINMWSAGHLISVSALKEHFDIYLYFSLNDRLLISVIPLALFR